MAGIVKTEDRGLRIEDGRALTARASCPRSRASCPCHPRRKWSLDGISMERMGKE